MTAAPIFMLRTVASDGTLEQFLPDFSTIDMSPVYCDAGTVTFSYPQSGVNFALLKEDIEIAVVMNGVEIPDLRCKLETIEGDDATDAEGGELWKYTCRTMAGALDYAIVYPNNYVYIIRRVIGKSAPVSYASKTIGYIFNDLFTKAQLRGSLVGFTWDFTATHDSEGNTWSDSTDVSPDFGKTYLSLLKDLSATGTCEFNVVKRLIRIFDRDKMGTDRSVGTTPLIFRKGRDIKESPHKVDTRGLITAVLIGNSSNDAFADVDDATSIGVYGRREGFTSFGDIPWNNSISTSFLETGGSFYLSQNNKPAVEITHGLHFETEDQPRPITDFNVGDWAYTDFGQGLQRFRIMQWVASVAQDRSVTGSITMGRMFNTQLSQVNSAVESLTNGSSNAGSIAKNDGIAPAQVTGVIPTSANYFVNNIPRATLDVQWTAVTQNSDGSDITDLDYYQVTWKYTSDSGWRPSQRVEAEDGQTILQVTNLTPGAGVQVRVRAADVWNNFGAWSTTVPLTLAGDTIPPNQPAAPVVTSNVGTLRVVWSGLDSGGVAMPVDLAGVEVHVSTADFTPTSGTKKDTLPPGVLATTLTQGLTYGTEYWVKLVAVDTTGNRSTPSDTTSTSHVVLKQVVSTEIGTGQVGLTQTTFSDVGNLIDDGTFELSDNRTTRTGLIGTQHLSFDNATASNGTWSLRSDPWAGTSSESIRLQGSLPVKPGERVFGAADYRQTSDVPAGSFMTLAIKWVDKSGNYLDNTGTISNVFYTLSDNGFAAKDNIWHSRVTNVSQVAPPNSVNAEVWIITASRTAGTIWIDAAEVRKQIDTLLIQQAAITTALIADLAVNDAKIASASIGKLIAGTLNADMVVGARIKTADTGARAELNSGGFGLWNSAGTQTVAFSGADGSASMIGQLRSGTSGRRIEINPTVTFLPEIRFYPTSGSNFGFLNAIGGGSDVSIGLNSGQYTVNSLASESRVFLSPTTSAFEQIDVTGQAQNGPGLYLFGNSWTMNVVQNGGASGGIMFMNESSAKFGTDRGNTNSALMWMDSGGKILFTGEMNYFSDAQDALMMGHVDGTDGPISGYIFGWGFTLTSLAYPIVIPYDNDGSNYAVLVVARTTTSFTIHFTANTTGAGYGFHYWAWRL
jgi:hypothetical protein